MTKFASGRKISFAVVFLLLSLVSVPRAVLGADEPGQAELDAMIDAAHSTLVEHHQEIAEKLENIPGYAVIAMSTTKIPGVGTGLGYGAVIDSRTDKRSYIKVTQFEVGGGLGAQRFKAVILFEDPILFERTIKGGWHFEGSADFSGTGDGDSEKIASVSTQSDKGYRVYKLAEGGALATLTIRALHGKPYLVD